MDTELIDLASNGHYSDFSKKITEVMRDKLNNNDMIKDYCLKYDTCQNMKQSFSDFNQNYSTDKKEE